MESLETQALEEQKSPRSRENAEHYNWGEGCDGWHLLRRPELSVIQERVPPGAGELRHRHGKARQLFYVLEGRITLEVEGTSWVLTPGQSLEVPPGKAHQLSNSGRGDALFLVVSAPHSHGDRELAPRDELTS